MDEFYLEMEGIASDLLSEFKQGEIHYVAVVPGSGPGDDPGPSVETATKINAVARGVKFKYIDNSNIVASDLQLTMPGGGVRPDISGFVRIDGTPFKIVQVIQKPAAGTPVAFTVIFRK